MSWFASDDCSIDEFIDIVEQTSDLSDFPHASRIEQGALVYESATITSSPRRDVASEIARALSTGPGIVVFAGAIESAVIDAASNVFHAIIEQERHSARSGGDHFAPAGANDRIWNALQKLAAHDADVFTDYYASEIIALASTAWLGPGYQVTSQVNVVNPGGQAQQPHRDYHLGFMENAVAEQFPAHVHRLSPTMTLQGAVAHCDMPLETGPTMYLPHSQKYDAGYVAWRRDDFRAYFAEHHVQVELEKGDAVFFNPALFHGAGTNRTSDVHRMANLLQIGSALGRTLEAVDRRAMVLNVYPTLLDRQTHGADRAALDRVVAATAEGYAFPCDLDVDQPIDGLTPPSDADLVSLALDERWTLDALMTRLG